MIGIFAITLTIGVFLLARMAQRRLGWVALNPILVAIVIIILILKLSDISYETYSSGGKYLEFFLKPAIVALGIPLYLQLEQIRKQSIPILASQLAGCIAGVISVVLIGRYLGASTAILMSLAPKSATTPIAIEVSHILGGIPALSAIIVILTGIFGAIFGELILRLSGVKSRIAKGLAMGAAAHAVGTSHALQISARRGAYSSLGLIINGTLTGLLTPYLLVFLGY